MVTPPSWVLADYPGRRHSAQRIPHSVFRLRTDDPLKRWGEAIAQRRGKRIAVVAVARRLVGIL